MDAQRYERLRELFGQALALPPEDRKGHLAAGCDDPEMRTLALRMLAAHHESEPLQWLAAPHPMPAGDDEVARSAIGPYMVKGEIGRGGMGVVYLAEKDDPAFRQQVAVKVLRRGLDTDDVLRRFESERRVLARLQHPGIVRLLDGGATSDGRPYFAMEFVRGLPIHEYARAQALDVRAIVALMVEVGEAVDYAHRNLVLHRDLKPANILVDDAGRPHLLDFGIARALDREPGEEETRTSERRLTPAYASPEQILGRPLSTASDVYSLGVILYELIAGRRPIEPADPADLRPFLEEEPRRPSQVTTDIRTRREVRGDLDTIVLKALARDPSRRYPGAGDLKADLSRFLEGRPVSARPDTLRYRLMKFARGNRGSVAAGFLALVAATAGLASTLYQARIARIERERAVRRFDETRKVAHSLLFDIHDSMMNLPGATPARSLIVNRTLEFLDSLSTDPASDPALIHEMAQAYAKAGDVQGLPRYANLGDRAGARASYLKALAARESIRSTFAADPSFILEGLQLEQRMGELDDADGRLDSAAAHFRRAVAEGRALVASPRAPDSARRELATALALLGDVQGGVLRQNLGDPEGARRSYAEAVAIVDAWLASDPRSGERRHFSANFHARLGRALQAEGHSAEAMVELRHAIDILDAMRREFPDVTPIHRDLAGHRRSLALALIAADRPEEALTIVQPAVAANQRLAAEHPDGLVDAAAFASSGLAQAQALLGLRRPKEARSALLAAAAPLRTTRARPDRAAELLLARIDLAQAQAAAALGERAAAEALRAAARSRARSLVEAGPADVAARELLAMAEGRPLR